jgi:P pilus assembly chaperone PapD
MTGIKINNTPLNPNSGSFNNNGYVSYDESMEFWTFSTPVESGTMTLSAVNACGEGSQSNGVIVPASS